MATRKQGPIALGIVGLGRAGWGMHVRELEGRKDKFRIVAGCDVRPDRRERLAKAFGCRTYARIADMLKDPEMELVSIATRSTDHVDHARLALKAGLHVFLEKPIAVNYPEARRLVPAARQSRGQLFIRHNRRFEPMYQHIREIMASGLLGDVYEIKLRRHNFMRRDDWQTLKRCGGGQLLNWGPHIVDHALRLLESPVADMWSDLKRVAAVGDAEDHIKMVLRGRNGRVVDMEISGGTAIPEPEYLVHGTRGALRAEGERIRMRYIDPKKRLARRRASAGTPESGFGTPETLPWIEDEFPVKPALPVEMPGIWDSLYAAIREGQRFPITLDEALDVMRVISAVRRGTPFA